MTATITGQAGTGAQLSATNCDTGLNAESMNVPTPNCLIVRWNRLELGACAERRRPMDDVRVTEPQTEGDGVRTENGHSRLTSQ